MISAILLATYAITAGTLGAGWLRDAAWLARAPRLAIGAWQALAASVLLALAAAGLALAISFPHVSADLAGLFDLCAENLRHGYASPGGTATALIGVAVFAMVVARAAWCGLRTTIADHRERAARVAALDMVGRINIVAGALVIDHAAPYAFCIGGRRDRVVVTSGLLATLDGPELDAVLAHERAHLSQRHHLAMTACRILFATLAPLFPGFRRAMPQVRMYAELCADDCARRHADASSLRTALLRLACLPAPAGALAASAIEVETRLMRLASGEVRLSRLSLALAASGIAAAIVVPLLLAAGPALAMAWEGICLLG
jgi:Zn-dependent protease with chaperone function